MEPDITKLEYYSGDPIDKVVSDPVTVSYVLSGPSGSNYATSDQVIVQTVLNPYGKKCLVRYRWSIDGVNFNEPGTELEYSFSIDATALGGPVSDGQPGIQASMSIGVDAGLVYFKMINGYHGNVKYQLVGPDLYTAIPLTFTIKYVLYEID